MPGFRCKIKKLRFQGILTDKETERILDALDKAEKTAEWIKIGKGIKVTEYKCSACGRVVRDDTDYDVTADYPYCHCGCRMKEGDTE